MRVFQNFDRKTYLGLFLEKRGVEKTRLRLLYNFEFLAIASSGYLVFTDVSSNTATAIFKVDEVRSLQKSGYVSNVLTISVVSNVLV